MNREFLDYYNRELKVLYERSAEFAEEYKGVAERLGGLVEGRMDPGIVGLLEGCAFMAARVQLKLHSEFSQFTEALLEQLLPNYLAPIPSAALVAATPPMDNPDLDKGITFKRGSYIDAAYMERERRVSCRYRLSEDLKLWPLEIAGAEYFPAPAPLQALGLETGAGVASGMRLSFRHGASTPDDGAPGGKRRIEHAISHIMADELPIHILGTASDGIALYEQLFANFRKATIRYLDQSGDPVFLPAPVGMLQQVGFAQDDNLFAEDERTFNGFGLLRDFFAFPNKFLGFRLTGLRALLQRIDAPAFDLLFEFDNSSARLASVTNAAMFSLYTVPAANLFEMTASRIPVRRGEHEYHVVPDRSRVLDFEARQIIDVFAHYPRRTDKERVYPLYSLPSGNVPVDEALFYAVRRLPRRRTVQERRTGAASSYTGSDLFISLHEPAGLDDALRVRELSVRCLATNRHLPEQLPIGEAGADFFLLDNASIRLRCVAGPTPPRESIVNIERKQRDMAPAGRTLWKLINFLSLNHLGLIERDEEEPAEGLRELLSIFADMSDTVTERRIRGVEGIATRPTVRRLRQKTGFNAARGVEITVRIDEKAFEGNGIFLLGAVLDRFFSEYTSINSFTETVIESKQRGVIKRWPPRSGQGRLL